MTTTVDINGRNALSADPALAAIRAREAELDAQAAEHWFDRDFREARAKEIASIIYEGFQHEQILPELAEVEYADKGDRITFEEVRGLEVFYVSGGGRIDESTIDEKVWEMRRDRIGYHVTEYDEKMESGFSHSAGQIVDLAIQQMDAGVNKRLFGLYQAAIPGSSSPYYVSGAGLSLPALRTAITEVKDAARSNDVTILGRSTMVDQIIYELQDANGFTPATNEELARGILGQFQGAKIVSLLNYLDSRGRPFIPGNELIVTTPGAAKVGFWGGLRSQEWSEQGGFYWHNFGYRVFGMVLRKKSWVRRFVDTSRNP